MPNRYIANDAVHRITSKSVVTGATDADRVNNVDTRNYDAIMIVTKIANLTSGALDYTGNKTLAIQLQHSPDNTAANYENVTANDVYGDATAAQLQIQGASLGAGAEVIKISWYRGFNRFIRIGTLKGAGTAPTTGTVTIDVYGLRAKYFA